MIIALTGASGFLGHAIARALADRGHAVTALVRASSERTHIESSINRFVVGDHADPRIWPELLENADAVVHNSVNWPPFKSNDLGDNLRSNLNASILLLNETHNLGIKDFVFISSVAVHHAMSDRWNGLIDEDHPLRPGGLYGAYKAAVEAHLWAAHASWEMKTVALRPSAVYGVEPINTKRSHGYRLVKRLLDGKRVTPANQPGGGKFVHVDDVAIATANALERDAAAGRAFNMADCSAKFTRFAEHARDILGLPEDMVEPDTGPPPKNQFDKTACCDVLSVPLDRGDAGLREYTAELIEEIRARSS